MLKKKQWQLALKRAFDLEIALIMLIPLSIVIGITNAMNGYYGPIIQSEKRMGKKRNSI